MLTQLILGSAITFVSLAIGAVFGWVFNEILERMEPWLKRPSYPGKSLVVVLMAVLTTMAMMTFGVWLWAIVFERLSVFTTLEEAVYYSLVAYTTLGLGDVILPQDHRLLGGMTGANGFLMFGLMTALLTNSLRHVRKAQHSSKD